MPMGFSATFGSSGDRRRRNINGFNRRRLVPYRLQCCWQLSKLTDGIAFYLEKPREDGTIRETFIFYSMDMYSFYAGDRCIYVTLWKNNRKRKPQHCTYLEILVYQSNYLFLQIAAERILPWLLAPDSGRTRLIYLTMNNPVNIRTVWPGLFDKQ